MQSVTLCYICDNNSAYLSNILIQGPAAENHQDDFKNPFSAEDQASPYGETDHALPECRVIVRVVRVHD